MQISQEQSNITITIPRTLEHLRIALVHDFLIYPGGAERVLEVLSEMFPEAPIYTLLYDPEKMRGKFKGKDIQTSFLQKFPKFLRKRHRWLLPFLPTAPETLDLRDFDLVISSSGAWSKGIVTRLNTIHIAYIHSPMRFAWDYHQQYADEIFNFQFSIFNFFKKVFIKPLLNYLRIWDRQAAERPDYLIANSRYTQDRIRKYYRRESEVIYPPAVDESGIKKQELGDTTVLQYAVENKYFLVVSRLSPYKKIDTIIEAFNKLGLPLVIIGEGEQKKYLQKIAGKNIKFLGWQPDEKVGEYYSRARAFIFAGDDDFGIAPVEAMSCGVPVIAIRKGGAKEIVAEGKTGEFFEAATPEVIADGVRRFIEKEKNYDKNYIKERANEFSKERFIGEFGEYIKKVTSNP